MLGEDGFGKIHGRGFRKGKGVQGRKGRSRLVCRARNPGSTYKEPRGERGRDRRSLQRGRKTGETGRWYYPLTRDWRVSLLRFGTGGREGRPEGRPKLKRGIEQGSPRHRNHSSKNAAPVIICDNPGGRGLKKNGERTEVGGRLPKKTENRR